MKKHNCTSNGDTHVHTLSRQHIGQGRYIVKGLCQGIEEGDTYNCFTANRTSFSVDKILSIRDAKANNWPVEMRKDAYFEAEMIDKGYSQSIGASYSPYNM